MVMEFGMSETLGPLRFGQPRAEVFLGRDLANTPDYSDEIAASIDAEVRRLIESAHEKAHDILHTNRTVLDHLARELIANETVETDRVMEIFGAVEPWTAIPESGSGRAASAAATDTTPKGRRPKP
jgi:cell division protease FtsH